MLPASRESVRALIIGGRGGIGAAYGRLFNPANTVVTTRDPAALAGAGAPAYKEVLKLDFRNEADFRSLTQRLKEMEFQPDVVLNCTGALALPNLEKPGEIVRPESSAKKITEDSVRRSFEINVFPNALLLRELAAIAKPKEPLLFATWSARVGSTGANEIGGWYSYRAAKAAINSLVKTASIEFRRSHPKACLLAVHPGTVQTDLSTPFVGKEKKKTLQSEVLGDKAALSGYFTPDVAAELMWTHVLSAKTEADTGKFFDYAGEEIPW
mmetsp:Transcript_6443/g.15916  ORF Transcript_6443/g.15916 Transcript_6443/m.15916 type:complete len:269 (-) Transcript_6443:596-1402(-)|eukprot:CAMPEP_0178993740 /NCGR_PEP_ID=MMETSP0795-20121207/6876_1 /TAXON_ID=88552 /ORGANISM="Amoebophrya sp., Strain Ameob2" /LENGTH=268 /DNA_ID=CAMNT_0020685843 /DNA_START=270 /DNA_END=1076 /DNA_ORIENTATION=-